MSGRVQSDADRKAVRAIASTLRDCGVEADVMPPYEAPIPVWYCTVVFGEPDERGYPYELRLEDGRIEIIDRAGDPIALASSDPEQRVSGAVALAVQVMAREQFLDDEGESLEGRCGWCNRNVDNFTDGHRVTSIVRGGRGVECYDRGDIHGGQAAPLKRMGMPR